MGLSLNQIKEVLQLKAPDAIIDEQIAERQLNVIHRAFNHLIQEQNNFIYIGDEVGLGKTYIALGLACLLRHFSSLPENYYQDVVIVPKKNLQDKWENEYNKFIKSNYLRIDNRVKASDNSPIGKVKNHHKLGLFRDEMAAFHIFRMSSFSMSRPSSERVNNWTARLREQIKEHIDNSSWILKLFDKGIVKYQLKDNLIIDDYNLAKFKRFYAFLLNACLPEIECLIVDEAHNFKHGIEGSVSTRNRIISRFFGAVHIDQDIADDFKDEPLFQHLHPKSKVKKLIFLSATPIDKSLNEIPKQLSCFLNNHWLHNIEDDKKIEYIKSRINHFMIRGLMNLKIKDTVYSRNMYRHEHRKGNVNKVKNANFQTLDKDLDGLIMGLVQYKVIKEIGASSKNTKQGRGVKNNKSFEIGMLASYESFNQSKVEKEYENRKESKDGSIDNNILQQIVQDYQKEFNVSLPHPKQDKLVKQLTEEYLDNQQKALVFVRRIATASELEQRLLDQYERKFNKIIKQLSKRKTFQTTNTKALLKAYSDRNIALNKDSVLEIISDYILERAKYIPLSLKNTPLEEVIDFLNFLYVQYDDVTDFVQKNLNTTEFSKKFFKIRPFLTEANMLKWNEEKGEIENEADKDEVENERFFYSTYFNKSKKTEGFKYRAKSYRENWFEINLILFNNHFKLFKIDVAKLKEEINKTIPKLKLDKKSSKTKVTKRQRFVAYQAAIWDNLAFSEKPTTSGKKDDLPEELYEENFITRLLINECQTEMKSWLKRRLNNKSVDFNQFRTDFEQLLSIIKQIFSHGSGLIPAYLASGSNIGFNQAMKQLLSKEFAIVLTEIKTIIRDYDTIIKKNFDSKSKHQPDIRLRNQAPVIGTSGEDKRDKSTIAAQFRMPGFPYVLITTDVLKEGEDLHSYCQDVFHYGIAWNPTDIEQRIGRVDRIGSLNARRMKQDQAITFDNKVHVFYPYLADTLEVNQVKKVFDGMNNFIETFYQDIKGEVVKNKSVSTSDLVHAIPSAITSRLQSPFEYHQFHQTTDRTDTQFKERFGLSYDDVQQKLEGINTFIQSKFQFYKVPTIYKNYLIEGTLKIEANQHERRGPFRIQVTTQPNDSTQFALKLHSYVCKYEEETETVNNIKARLDEYGYQSTNLDSYLIGIKYFDWEAKVQDITDALKKLVKVVDDLEREFTNRDEVVFV